MATMMGNVKMDTTTKSASAQASKGVLWTGRMLSGLATAFLLFDSAMKLVKAAPAVQGTVQLGFPESTIVPIGVILLISVVAYVLPQTSVLGAILLTGYLGGAIASQARVGNPMFSHILFPIYVAAMIWSGLYLRDERVRALLPLSSRQSKH